MTFCHFYFILIININMIKKYIINKFTVYMMCFLLLAMFCLFPVKDVVLEEKIYNKEYVVYLLDGDNYLSKVTYFYDELTLEKEIENKKEKFNGGCIFLVFIGYFECSTRITSRD